MTSKQQLKQRVRRLVGEPYVGKRLKRRWLAARLPVLAPAVVLDLGSEDASFTYWLADQWPRAQIIGLDRDEAATAACTAARPPAYRDRVRFMCGELGSFESESIDVVTAFDVLEHIEDDGEAVRGIARVLRRGGRLLVHVPAERYLDAKGRVHTIPDSEAWRVNAGHVRAGYAPEALASLARAAGLEVEMLERWNRRWSAHARATYTKLEHPAALRLVSLPITDVCAVLDRRRPEVEGNTVWMVAVKP